MEVIPTTTVVIILQYVSVSNQHIIHLKFIQYYMSIISDKVEKEKTKNPKHFTIKQSSLIKSGHSASYSTVICMR